MKQPKGRTNNQILGVKKLIDKYKNLIFLHSGCGSLSPDSKSKSQFPILAVSFLLREVNQQIAPQNILISQENHHKIFTLWVNVNRTMALSTKGVHAHLSAIPAFSLIRPPNVIPLFPLRRRANK